MSQQEYGAAMQDFQKARQQAALQKMIARWTGRSLDLLSYDEVKEQLRVSGKKELGLRVISLDAIVGSVGRYRDFTRTFLPRVEEGAARWAQVKVAQVEKGLSAITVYQIGEVYFVLDGNHRVSVAREMGSETIEAYVTEVKTRVPLTPDDEPADIILKAEYADFLDRTHLDEVRADVDLWLTSPGKYPLLLEHIEVHRYYMGLDQDREIPYEEAVIHWCDEVYRPTVRLIRESGLMRGFPERTEVDMYVWLADRRAEIEKMLGWEVPMATAIRDMVTSFGSYKPHSLVDRVINAVRPGTADTTRPVGQWRRERTEDTREPRFFDTLLVPMSGNETGWQALDQAIVVAGRAGSHIYGLFPVAEEADKGTILTSAFQAEFERRCDEAGVEATFIAEVGDFEQMVSKRGRWADVMVLGPAIAPAAGEGVVPLSRRIIRRASALLLIVPREIRALDRVLLAYDDRPESNEALYVAAYLGCQWGISISVLHVAADKSRGEVDVGKAVTYLEDLGIEADILIKDGNVPEAILSMADELNSELIVMGSPNLGAMRELVLGSTVKEMLRSSRIPMLLCR